MSGKAIMSKRTVVILLAVILTVAAQLLAGLPPANALSPVPDDTWMPSGTVFDTELSADGKTLYVGGKFSAVRENPPGQGGQSIAVKNLAAFNVATGAMITGFKPQVTGDASANVRELAFKNGKLYIGGTFTAVNGQPRANLAAVNATTGAVDAFAPQVRNSDGSVPLVYALETDDSKLYVGGRFNFIGSANRAKIAAFSLANGTLDANWKPKTNKEVMDLQMSSDGASIFAVGRFINATGSNGALEARKNVVRFDAASGNVHPWTVPAGVIGETEQTAHDVLVTPTKIYVGLGDKGPNYISAFRLDDGDTGSEIWRYGTVGDVQSIALSANGKRLFFGGHFGLNVLRQQACDNRYVHGIASLNPNNGAPYCDWLPQIEPFNNNGYGPWDMNVTTDGRLWVGGGFNKVSGSPQLNLAGFNPNAKLVNQAPKVDLDGFGKASGPRAGGLDVTYYDNPDFTGTEVTGSAQTVDFDWGGGSPEPGIGSDGFSARYTGQVQAPTSGEYTFTTTSDDGVRLFVDGKLLVDNWTDHGPTDDSGTITLEAGKKYDVRLDYFENGGGAVAKLSWQYPGQDRQIIPSSNLFLTGTTGGLDATYYDNMDLTGPSVSRVDPRVDFNWGDASPIAGIDPETFSARWTGQIEAPVSGEYTFYVSRDNGGRLKVNDEWLIEEWSDTWGVTDTGTINLQAGERYPIVLDYFDNTGGANVRLEWSAPGLNRQVIPTSNLSYSGGADYAATFTGGPTSIVDSANLAVSDADDANLSSATVTLTNRPNGVAESLAANVAGTGLVSGYNAQTGVLTLGGTAPKATYSKVLRTITYNNTAANPMAGDRTVTFAVSDGASTSGAAVSTVTVP